MKEIKVKQDNWGSAKVIAGHPHLLDCPSCKSFISADQIDLDEQSATCGHCNLNFSFADALKKDPIRRPEMIMPQAVDVLKLQSKLDIIVDWYGTAPKRSVSTNVFGAFFWNVIMLPIVAILLYYGHFLFVLVFIGHLITGGWLLLNLLATFINKTHIIVTKDGIEITHGPIKNTFRKNQTLASSQIEQLYVSRYTERYNEKSKRGMQAYALSAIMKDNKVVELLKGMDRKTQLYLEQEIETYLEIKDKKIKGEVPRV